MNYTDSQFERMMKQVPRYASPSSPSKAPQGSSCRDCGYWRGMACVGICYRRLKAAQKEGAGTSGQVGPKSHGG